MRSSNTMILETESLDLRLRTTDEVLAWVDSLDAATRAEVSPDWIARIASAPSTDAWTHGFEMIDRTSGEAVGSCAFKGPPDSDGAVEIGYGVDEEYRGRGYAMESARAVVRHALASDDVRIVRAHMRPDGAASMRVLERCGFERIGEVIDAEDGLVIRWEIRKCAPPH
jgi:[ribosomal protein S5]-alanine N-acetyltransferase